jgi:hypothetical protein
LLRFAFRRWLLGNFPRFERWTIFALRFPFALAILRTTTTASTVDFTLIAPLVATSSATSPTSLPAAFAPRFGLLAVLI